MYHDFNKRQVIAENPDGTSETMYESDGNIFRTFKLTEEEIMREPEKYLDYEEDAEPTKEKIKSMLILTEVEKHYILSSKGEK